MPTDRQGTGDPTVVVRTRGRDPAKMLPVPGWAAYVGWKERRRRSMKGGKARGGGGIASTRKEGTQAGSNAPAARACTAIRKVLFRTHLIITNITANSQRGTSKIRLSRACSLTMQCIQRSKISTRPWCPSPLTTRAVSQDPIPD